MTAGPLTPRNVEENLPPGKKRAGSRSLRSVYGSSGISFKDEEKGGAGKKKQKSHGPRDGLEGGLRGPNWGPGGKWGKKEEVLHGSSILAGRGGWGPQKKGKYGTRGFAV